MSKILVIEDELSVRENILARLEAEGFETLNAENGINGIAVALAQTPDLIICDVMMPELDGYGVLTTLRQDPLTATIPFIFLTAKADKGDIREGMELGADDYLTKPFSRDELLQSIIARLKKQAAMRQQTSGSASPSPEAVSGVKSLQPSPKELQRQVKALQQSFGLQEELLPSHQELSNFLAKINMAIFMLQNTTSEVQRDRCLGILQEACTDELKLLNQMPHLQELLSPENLRLLLQFSLIHSDITGQVSDTE
ncbi:MAG TPA: response regulator [Cyanobacteria bacterium UBA11049]|nr:response regulator [Cyanobacteria bacterium UBA11049]